jgi:hypothetical protein
MERDLALHGADSPSAASPTSAHISGGGRASMSLQPTLSMQESASTQRHAEYVGIRRLTRELRNGEAVQPWLDAVVDACGHMVNLRTVVGVYRAHGVQQYIHRTEGHRMWHAFSRDIVALCRYCLLLVYAAYLDRHRAADAAPSPTFSEWIASMASVQVCGCDSEMTRVFFPPMIRKIII